MTVVLWCVCVLVCVCVCAHASLNTPMYTMYRHTWGVPVCLGICLPVPVSESWNCMDP